MSNASDKSNLEFIIDSNFDINIGSPLFPEFSAEEYADLINQDGAFKDIIGSFPHQINLDSLPTDAATPAGFSPEHSSNSNHQNSSNFVAQAVGIPNAEPLKIIAQPYYGTKLRYGSDFTNVTHRLGVLKNRNKNSSYQGPAIQIPKQYLNPEDQYHIRICLVTVIHDRTKLRYIHPYILEHALDEQMNDRLSNSVYFPLQDEDYRTGIKSFPTIRIVKRLVSEIKNSGNLRVFDGDDQNNIPSQSSSMKEVMKDYNLKRSQLAFTIIKKINVDGKIFCQSYPDTTAYSEDMIEGNTDGLDIDNDIQSLNDATNAIPSLCRVYKYAPKYGFDCSSEDMMIFLTNKLEPRKYGPLKVTFECNISDGRWSQSVTDLDIKDRMVSFKTPVFPCTCDETQPVDIILRQDHREIGVLSYFYISTFQQCLKCQLHTVVNPTNLVSNKSNKRSALADSCMEDLLFDSVVPILENSHELQQSLSEPAQVVSPSPPTVSKFVSLPPVHTTQTTNDEKEIFMNLLATSVESLFTNNDYTPFLRICRSFVKKRPQLLHDAISNNYCELLTKFIPLAFIDTLREKNEMHENILLHAVRLNRIEIVKILLAKKDSETLIENIDKNKNNIFHLITLNSPTSSEMLDLMINYFNEKSISIQEKFDHLNQDYYTPLQLSISKNNLLITKTYLKYFNTNVYALKNGTGDNLIHLAVRFSSLAMIQYLIEDGQLEYLGNKSNLTMTPKELAQSLKHDDIIQYLNTKYLQEQISEDTSSSDDDEEEEED